MIERFMNDPQGNVLALIVLIALIFSWIISLILILKDTPVSTGKSWYTVLFPVFALLAVPAALDLIQTSGLALALALVVAVVLVIVIVVPLLVLFGKSSQGLADKWPGWIIPVLVAGGLAVAGYLTFVEATDNMIQCGPLSQCGSVQESQYAVLFGILPIGALGLVGYLTILLVWLVWFFGPNTLKNLSALAIWGMCIFGVLFSFYLTFLEPFVIGATCMWCIASAVLMILLLWASTPLTIGAMAVSDPDSDI